MVEEEVVAVVVERGHPAAWSINLDFKLLAAVYGALLSGAAYYVMGVVVKKKGPVFYPAFNPLATVLVVILGSFFLAEQLYTGSILGAVTIAGGLYLVLWGKARDQPIEATPAAVLLPLRAVMNQTPYYLGMKNSKLPLRALI